MAKLRSYVDDINGTPDALAGSHGPSSRYELPEEGLKGRVELKFYGEKQDMLCLAAGILSTCLQICHGH